MPLKNARRLVAHSLIGMKTQLVEQVEQLRQVPRCSRGLSAKRSLNDFAYYGRVSIAGFVFVNTNLFLPSGVAVVCGLAAIVLSLHRRRGLFFLGTLLGSLVSPISPGHRFRFL